MQREVSAMKTSARVLLVALAAAFLLVGCLPVQQGPRYIDQVTSSKKSVKLLYRQQVGAQNKRGLIECDRADDGALENCQNVNINFKED